MATLCEAAQLNKQAAQLLRTGMGGWVIDIAGALAILERGSECCSPDNEENT